MALTAAQEKLCKTCGTIKPLDDFQRRNDAPNATHQSRCKKCKYEYDRSLPSLRKAQDAWRKRNRDRVNENARRNRSAKPENFRAAYERWREKNKPYCAEASRRRQARQLQACPPWVNLDDVRSFYVKAKARTIETGIEHQVDHIYPLKSDVLCGLHVPWNLQILTKSQNASKKNKIVEVATWL